MQRHQQWMIAGHLLHYQFLPRDAELRPKSSAAMTENYRAVAPKVVETTISCVGWVCDALHTGWGPDEVGPELAVHCAQQYVRSRGQTGSIRFMLK